MNCGLTSEWFTMNNIDEFFKIVKPGDKIEFGRGLYRHFAVYIGEAHVNGRRECDCIMHVTTTEDTDAGITTAVFASSVKRSGSSSLAPENIGKPYIQSIRDYLADKPTTAFRINNGKDEEWKPYKSDEIIKTAFSSVDDWDSYDLLDNNCEHFSNHCRYGVKHSDQCETFTKTATTVAVLGIAAGLGFSFLRGFNKDKQKQ